MPKKADQAGRNRLAAFHAAVAAGDLKRVKEFVLVCSATAYDCVCTAALLRLAASTGRLLIMCIDVVLCPGIASRL